MLKKIFLSVLIVCSVFALSLSTIQEQPGPQIVEQTIDEKYTEEWAKVEEFKKKGLPQSALEVVEQIYKKAKSEGNSPQIVKCIIHRLLFTDQKEEKAFENAIEGIKQEITTAQFPLKNVLHSTLAEMYWWYYQSNRWQIMERSSVHGIELEDIETWDLKKLAEVANYHYEQSLDESLNLKKIATSDYKEVIVEGRVDINFRPSLFDFLAHRAIDFYTNGEAGLSEAFDAFKLNKAVFLSPYEEFAESKIFEEKNQESFDYKAIILMQKLIKSHLNDPDALADIDLKRLHFARQRASSIPNAQKLYEETLEKSLSKLSEFPASSRYAYEIARMYQERGSKYDPFENTEHQWELKKALEICEEQMAKYPKSIGANDCRNLITHIKSKDFSLKTESVMLPNTPLRAVIEHRNIEKLHFKLLRIKEMKSFSESRKNSEELLGYYLQQKQLSNWNQSLPNLGDYQSHKIDLPLPELEMGRYVLLISEDPIFSLSNYLQIQTVEFSVSNLAYTSRHGKKATVEYYLADRKSGIALKGVKAEVYNQSYDYVKRETKVNFIGNFYSDENGKVEITSGETYANSIFCVFSKDRDTLCTVRPISMYQFREDNNTYFTTHFFTDRKIYRPGQTIYFKGICIGKNKEEVKIQAGRSLTVHFYDVNSQLISKQNLTTNDYGTFNGSFTAPQGILNGVMRITDNHGSHSFAVEDYKRPKFQLSFEPLKGSYKLGQEVIVKGSAMAYSGAPISNASLSYRIIRNPNYNYYWYKTGPSSPQLELGQGEITTDDKGQFTIPFEAIGENKSTEEFYNFTIYVDVTDINGETQSNQKTVSVGSKALLISAGFKETSSFEDCQKIGLISTNLNGQFVSTDVNIKIWRLEQPSRLFKKDRLPRADQYLLGKADYIKKFPFSAYEGEDDARKWEKAELVKDVGVTTSPNSEFQPFTDDKIESGKYLVQLTAVDTFGTAVKWEKYITLYKAKSPKMPLKSFDFFEPLNTKAEVDENVSFIIGSSAEKVKVLFEIEHGLEILHSEWISLNNEKKTISIPVLEKYRGNFAIHLTMIKEGELYSHSQLIQVPYSNKKLSLQFTTFRDKLLPGQQEKWTVSVSGPEGEKVDAELLASMYDASLDQFEPNNWNLSLYDKVYNNSSLNGDGNFGITSGRNINNYRNVGIYPTVITYDRLNWFGFSYHFYQYGYRRYNMKSLNSEEVMYESDAAAPASIEMKELPPESLDEKASGMRITGDKYDTIQPESSSSTISEPTKTRSNFNETAFFYPELRTDSAGNVNISFTIPESLTKWKLLGMAHTKDLKTGFFTKEIITQKSLMVVSNPPRFFREGDEMSLSVKLSNLTADDLNGRASITFIDVYTGKDITANLLQNDSVSKAFKISSKLNSSLKWKVKIPDGLQAVTYRIEAKSGNFADGEEYLIPVLTNRMLVTESMPFNIKGNQKKQFTFEKLLNSNSSNTLRHQRLTLEYTANPAWYAIQALPYLMEYPYECAEQLFSRYYANSIAAHIANSSPKIKAVFDSWKLEGKDALLSNLEKNQELKALLLEETPWVMEAQNESERKKRLGLLFDVNHIGNELSNTFRKLKEMQYSSGAWPWFKGMEENRYITQHIVSGLGHLKKLGIVENDNSTSAMIQSAVYYLDSKIYEDYQRLITQKVNLSQNNLGTSQIQYLYARSFFKELEVNQNFQEAHNYYREQAKKYWLQNDIYLQGMIAITLNRTSDPLTAKSIIASLNEKAIHNEEMGMYWKRNNGYYWQNAPIERQALLIEAYGEITNDSKSVEEMKIWLLKQKQTQDWKTTRATTEACYALLLEGMDLLQNEVKTEFTLGSQSISSDDPSLKKQAGTGYFKRSWNGSEITPEMGTLSVQRTSENSDNSSAISWGAVYWQYFENLDKITSSETPLSIKKELFVEQNTKSGPVISAISSGTKIQVGDKIVVRIELRVDRDMSYVHMKDMRASGLEPTNVFSGYRYQDGLGYYETTRDAATNFFFDYLRKGTYVFEYSLRASIEGDYSNGITSIQCMYAPEFSSNSKGIRINILP